MAGHYRTLAPLAAMPGIAAVMVVLAEDAPLARADEALDHASAPLARLVEPLARRQFTALWSARSPAHGLVPNNSYQTSDSGMNTTAGLLWVLPAAVRHEWVTAADADRYVGRLVATLNTLLDRSRYLPPRNVDWVSLEPSMMREESSVDAALVALGLHQYRSLPTTPPALRDAILRTQERFDFAAFATSSGWRMAYRYASPSQPRDGFPALIYDGYTNEGHVISLAAHLATRHHVSMETCWNSDVQRKRAPLVAGQPAPVVHAWPEFRAPFTQALLNLFVDVRQRGVDSYPDSRLAANPWENFVRYERSTMERLAELGRPSLAQPDAGDDGSLANYQPFSLYHDFGQRDLFMPWSAALPLLAGVEGSEEAFRFLLAHGLYDSMGLADSARWKTGEPEPYAISPRHDFWNTALSTMALMEWLDGDARSSKSFAALPEVCAALDRVFPENHPREMVGPDRTHRVAN